MAKDPAFLFYSSDFLTGTMTLSDAQTGKYIKLLCLQHQKGRLSENDMLSICKDYDKEVFCKFKKDSDGNYFNERLEEEVNKRKKFTDSRKENRAKRNDYKSDTSTSVTTSVSTSVELVCNTSKTLVQLVENENIINNNTVEEKIENTDFIFYKNLFEEARKIYPGTKRSLHVEFEEFKKKYKGTWKEIVGKLQPAIENQIKHREVLANQNKFIPEWKYFRTWLNQGCWEEEVQLSIELPKSKPRIIV